MSISKNFRQKDAEAWIENPLDGGVDRRVNDSVAHGKLDTIAGALGVGDTTPSVINKAVPIAGAEISQALPANTKKWTVKSRLKGTVRIAYNSGETATAYYTLTPGNTFIDQNFYTGQTIYFQSTKAGDVLEIIAYV